MLSRQPAKCPRPDSSGFENGRAGKLPPSYHPAHNKPGKKRWGLLLGAVIVLGTLLFLINSVTSTIPMPPASGDYAADGNAAAPQNGVPMSAEDFLNNNR
ncbi:MAG: hypothetical protein LRZ85_02605 [Alphaproteobacteria bacterium]|nr:hypothetical protein [Alphaproteobacteria bacterium]